MKLNEAHKFIFNKIILLSILAVVIIGFFLGFRITTNPSLEFYRLIRISDVYLNIPNQTGNTLLFFAVRLLIHAQAFAIIWFLAHIPRLLILIYGLLFVYVFNYAVVFTVLYSQSGFKHAVALILPGALILLTVYTFTAYACIRHAVKEIKSKTFRQSPDLTYLLLGFLFSAAAAIIETWVTPLIIDRII